MQEERKLFKPSTKRDTPTKENLRLFQLLLKGDKEAEPYCLRAKAHYDSTNGEERGRAREGKESHGVGGLDLRRTRSWNYSEVSALC